MISIHGVTLKRNAVIIAQNFSLNIAPGKIVALVGPNGCGKSTSVSAIAGERNLYSGDIFYNGIDLKSLTIVQLAQLRSVVAQKQRFSLSFTVAEVLEMATLVSGSSQEINTAIDALDIDSLLNRTVTSLSGGEQQRVAIAMGLTQATPYLLLDEPFSAQDIASVARISSHLRQVADLGKGVLVVAHMAESELNWCDEVISFPQPKN